MGPMRLLLTFISSWLQALIEASVALKGLASSQVAP